MSIAFLTEHQRFAWRRQLVDRSLAAGTLPIVMNRIDPDCALLVVYDDIEAERVITLPRARRLVVLSEPPGIKTYRPSYLAQFGTVLGPVDPKCADVSWIKSQPALPWFYGVGFVGQTCLPNVSYDQLVAMPPPAKSETISVVISTKTRLPMHRQRLAFVAALKERLGERLHVFGTGFAQVPDKADAIRPHAYHLVLENNDIDHFWTEKTADAYLGWALPIFSGCRNLDQYFPAQSFIRIDPSDIPAAVGAVVQILREAPYASRLWAIREARTRLLNEHELGAALRAAALGLPADTPREATAPFRLRANRDLGPAGRLEPMARVLARRILRRPT